MIRITIRQMEYFDTLAQTLHFGRAANLAGVSQPALSSQIAEMEERLGCRLFERGGKSVRLTEDAVALQPRIEALLSQLREMESAAQQGRTAMQGRLRLGIIPTVAPYLLPYLLPALNANYPGIDLELTETLTASLIDAAAKGAVDCFVAAMPLDTPKLVTEPLFADRFFLAVPTDDPDFVAPPVPPESPALERLMLLEEGHCLRQQALDVCTSVKAVKMASYGATSLTTLLQMVAHGLGVTLVPEIGVVPAAAMDGVKIVPFAAPMPERQLCLAWRRGSSRQGDCLEIARVIRGLQPQLMS